MSHNLYLVRIQFDSQRGCVKAKGIYRQISSPPRIRGLPLLEMIDYTPEVGVAELRAHLGKRREMYEAERLACAEWIKMVEAGLA